MARDEVPIGIEGVVANLQAQLAKRLGQIRDLKLKLSEMEDERDRAVAKNAQLRADVSRLEEMLWESKDAR